MPADSNNNFPMPTKIDYLTNSPGGDHYRLNSTKSRMFAHSAAQYWDVFLELIEEKNFDLWKFMYVGLPIMHMSLELMVKAFVTFYDANYDPKSDRHKTSKIIIDHADKISELKLIRDDIPKMDLIKTLEIGWEGLRYAECTLAYDRKDEVHLTEIMTLLIGKYKEISGLRNL